MNPIDDQLNRLFRAAAQGTAQAVPDRRSRRLSGLRRACMAAWREAHKAGTGFWDMALLDAWTDRGRP